ncbi:hypothetical protein R3P38DRAFT_3444099, partial [Favolaschia claudopus]
AQHSAQLSRSPWPRPIHHHRVLRDAGNRHLVYLCFQLRPCRSLRFSLRVPKCVGSVHTFNFVAPHTFSNSNTSHPASSAHITSAPSAPTANLLSASTNIFNDSNPNLLLPPLPSPTTPNVSSIKIQSWNIDGSFILLMGCPETQHDLVEYDFNLYQETHLRPQQHDTISVPVGYAVESKTRRPKANFAKSWGGVANVFNAARVPSSKIRNDLSGPDLMVTQVGDILLFNSYLLPESSVWEGELERELCSALAASVAMAYAGGFRIIIMGDLNARTASEMPSVYDPVRISKDNKSVSPRGRFLFRLCVDYDLVLANGA